MAEWNSTEWHKRYSINRGSNFTTNMDIEDLNKMVENIQWLYNAFQPRSISGDWTFVDSELANFVSDFLGNSYTIDINLAMADNPTAPTWSKIVFEDQTMKFGDDIVFSLYDYNNPDSQYQGWIHETYHATLKTIFFPQQNITYLAHETIKSIMTAQN